MMFSRYSWPEDFVQQVPLDMQASNIGILDQHWFQQIAESFQARLSLPSTPSNIRVIFPSKDTLLRSPFAGEHGWYFYWLDTEYGIPWKFDMLYDSSHPSYPGLLLHSKVYKRTAVHGNSNGNTSNSDSDNINNNNNNNNSNQSGLGWIYIGGHNLSKSAWGVLSSTSTSTSTSLPTEDSTANIQNNDQEGTSLFINNFELGVLFIQNPNNNYNNNSNSNSNRSRNTLANDIVHNILPALPFPLNPSHYGENDQPWVCMRSICIWISIYSEDR